MRATALVILGAVVWGGCTTEPTPDAGADARAPVDDADLPDAPADADVDLPDSLPDGDTPPVVDGQDVLFVGNSYVTANDVAGHYRDIATALSGTVRVEAVAPGGYRLADHSMDASTDGTPLSRWLRTGTPEETSFDAVVLQEQSQIGGFPERAPERLASVEAASELAGLARARGATVVLYLTWGRERGDPSNPDIFGTFEAMQERLDAGYLGLAEQLRAEGSEVRVAPVGGGFRLVFEEVARPGGDPLAEGSDFDALYDADGSHPSVQGAYLAACIIAGTITGADVEGFEDEPSLEPETCARLRHVCARALADPRWHLPEVLVADTAFTPEDVSIGSDFGVRIAMSADGRQSLTARWIDRPRGSPGREIPRRRVPGGLSGVDGRGARLQPSLGSAKG